MATENFLTPEPVLYHTRTPGFAFFGAGHLASLALSAVIVALSLAWYLRLPRQSEGFSRQRLAFVRVLAGLAVAIILAKCLWYLRIGMLEPLFWPLHICNLCEFVALGYAAAPSSRVGSRLADLLFCWGLTGCLGALLFPGWAWYCPAWSLASLCGFVEHALVFACALCVLVGGEYVPHPHGVWFVIAATVACGAAARAINPRLGTNFFFVSNPIAAGWPFSWLVAAFGDPGFLVAYLAFAVVLWGAVYGTYRGVAMLRLRQQAPSQH